MDGVSIASGIISIATAGIQVSIKLATLSAQVSSASERVSSIANDVSLISGVLHQLADLMHQKPSGGESVFNKGGLETTRTSAAMCERIFTEIEKECGKASKQIRSSRKLSGGKVKLSKLEKLSWPFLQPSIDLLRADLREAKGTLMLMLQITTLALAKKMGEASAQATNEQEYLYCAIGSLHQEQQRGLRMEKATRKPMPWAAESQSLDLETVGSGSDLGTFDAITGDSGANSMEKNRPNAAHSSLPSSIRKLSSADKQRNPHGDRKSQGDYVSTSSTLPEGSVSATQSEIIPSADLTTRRLSIKSQSPYTTFPALHSGNAFNDRPRESDSLHDSQSRSESVGWPDEEVNLPMPLQKRKFPKFIGPELQMLMMKPMVKDFSDRIELSWSVLQPRMQESVVKDHLDRMKADHIPSVLDTLETLHEHEHTVLNTYQGKGELLSLKRTRTDIQHRDILFKDVPGLQFVVGPRPLILTPGYFTSLDASCDSSETEVETTRSHEMDYQKMGVDDFDVDPTPGSWSDEIETTPKRQVYSNDQASIAPPLELAFRSHVFKKFSTYDYQGQEEEFSHSATEPDITDTVKVSSRATPGASISSNPPHQQDPKPKNEVFKSFRVNLDVPTKEVLAAALRKYGIDRDSSDHTLYIVHEGQEQRMQEHDKPLLIFKQLDKEGKKPKFMLKKTPKPGDTESPDQSVVAPRSDDEPKKRTRVSAPSAEASIMEEEEDEYSSDGGDVLDDGGNNERMLNQSLVEHLLQEYTTWRPKSYVTDLPGGVL